MNKTSKILLCIIILLIVALGYFIYKFEYFKDGYLQATHSLYERTKLLEDSGVEIITVNNGKEEVHIKKVNTVIMD